MIRTLYLMPTHRCNSSCDYCYLGPEKRQQEGSAGLFLAVLGKFIELSASGRRPAGRPELRFIGGEPYLQGRLVRQLTLRFLEQVPAGRVLINTNGTLVTTAALEPLAGARRRIHHVVSLDGPAALHDARRHLENGQSAFSRALAGVRALQAGGFPVYINMVLDPKSSETLPELMRLLGGSLGLGALSVSLLQCDPPLDRQIRFELLARAYELAGQHGITLSGHHRLLLGQRIPALRCRAGERSLLITGDGQACVCQRFVGQGGVRVDPARMDFEALPGRHAALGRCYGPGARWLGERLHDLYKHHYPRYLRVTPLDRILYGTL